MDISKDLINDIMEYIENTEQFLEDEYAGSVDRDREKNMPEVYVRLSKVLQHSEKGCPSGYGATCI